MAISGPQSILARIRNSARIFRARGVEKAEGPKVHDPAEIPGKKANFEAQTVITKPEAPLGGSGENKG